MSDFNDAIEAAAGWHESAAAEWDEREDGEKATNWHADCAGRIRALKRPDAPLPADVAKLVEKLRSEKCQETSFMARPAMNAAADLLTTKYATLSALKAGRYLIWSNEHRAWWRPNRCGYTIYLEAAGRYPRDEAVAICRDARGGWSPCDPPPEMPIAEQDAADVARIALSPQEGG